jgi:hypothetical protein
MEKLSYFSLLNTKTSLHYKLVIGVYEIIQLFFKYGIVNGIIILPGNEIRIFIFV